MNEGLDPKAPRRKRVSRACDRCRSKKDKCDGIRPTCSACQATGQTCSYDPNAKKRGLPEGYVRGLEKLWALSMCNIEGLEDTMLTMLGATAESVGRRDRLLQLWTDESASDSLHEVWKTSRLWGALEKMLSNSDSDPRQSPLKRPRDEDSSTSPGTSGQWGFRVGRGPTPPGMDVPRVVDPHCSPGVKRARLSTSLPDSHRSPASSVSADASSLQLPRHASRLFDAYFSRTHPWFPVIAKHNILRAFYLYGNGPVFVGKSSPGSADHAALWAVLSYTTAQGLSDPGNTSGAIHDESRSALAKAREYYSVARGLIPSEKERFDLGHIQALLLLTLVNIGLEDWTAAWLLSGQSARMAETLELGKLADTHELRQRKAVFLGCFIIDSLLSVRLSRSPSMRAESLSLVGRLEEDGLEEWNPWMDVLAPNLSRQGSNPPQRGPLLALSCFNRLAELAGILNRIGRDFSQAANSHVFAQQMLVDLKPWDDQLPPGCRLLGPESNYPDRQPALLPHQTYLCITYAATLLFLYTRQLGPEHSSYGAARTALDGAKKILYRTLAVLTQHVENFRACGISPLFEFPLRSIFESVSTARPKLESDGFSVVQWVGMFSRKITELESSWPVFGSLGPAVEDSAFNMSPASSFSHQRPRKSPVSAGSSSLSYAPLRGEAKSYSADRAGRNSIDTQVNRRPDAVNDTESGHASKVRGLLIPADGFYVTSQTSAGGATGLSTGPENNPERSAETSTILLDKLLSSKGPVDSNVGLMHQRQPETPESAVSSAIMQSGAERFPGHSAGGYSMSRTYMPDESPSSSNDLDSIFKELAYLDTYEWANSREEGLREFGFIDDNTFQAFCHDPDRLVGSQPLVPPTTSIADIWPPPGFFPETFQASKESAAD
jgi:hypothetical protein